MPIPLTTCMLLAASFHHLPPRVIASIQHVEGGAAGSVHVNADGTEDLGLMQVNTRWLQPLAARVGADVASVRSRLLDDGCFNIAVGAAILRLQLDEARGDLMSAIGHYHSHTQTLSQAYQAKVVQAAWSLFAVKTTAENAPSPLPDEPAVARQSPLRSSSPPSGTALPITARSRTRLGHLSGP